MTKSDRPERGFTLTWMLDAPPADVFRAWTDPDHLGWFYKDDNPVPAEPIELDLRVGGVWRQQMVIDASTAYFTGGVYLEIVPDENLVYAPPRRRTVASGLGLWIEGSPTPPQKGGGRLA